MYDPSRSTQSHGMTGRSTVVGLFDDAGRARDAVEALKDAGFQGNEIGILMRDRDKAGEMAKETGTEAGSGAATGLIGGGILGGLAGWLVGIGALVIPGVGPFIAAGALGAALTGAAIGAGVGAIAGALVGMGIPKEEADWYENEVRGGRTMVTVKTEGRYAEARSVLRRYGAYDIENRQPDDSELSTGRTRTTGTTMGTRNDFGSGMDTDKESLSRSGRNDYGTSDRPSSGTGGIGTGSGTGLGSQPPSGMSSSGSYSGGTWEEVSPRFRSNWERRYGTTGTSRWEDLEPNYRYGWEMRSRQEYRGKPWNEVEPHFRRDWEGRYHDKPWDRAAQSIREAWEDLTDRDEGDRPTRGRTEFGPR
ncbi:MAG: general stress protein [Chloroflexota bacterium]